jgi:hypothetical protein
MQLLRRTSGILFSFLLAVGAVFAQGGYGGGASAPHWEKTVSWPQEPEKEANPGVTPVPAGRSILSGFNGMGLLSANVPWTPPPYGDKTTAGDSKYGTLYSAPAAGTWDLQGKVRFKYKWIPGTNMAPIPKQCVVIISGSASWGGDTGTCNVTVSGDRVETVIDSFLWNGSVSKTAYSVMNSSSGMIEVTATLSATGTTFLFDGPKYPYAFSAACSASSQIWSVEMNLSGTTPVSGNPNAAQILIGQKCGASLSLNGNVIPANASTTPPVKFDDANYQWTVMGKTFGKFKIWNDSNGINHGKMQTCEEQDQDVIPPVMPTDRWKSASPTWYWYDTDPPIITGKTKIIRQITNSTINDVEIIKSNLTIRKPDNSSLTAIANPTSSYIGGTIVNGKTIDATGISSGVSGGGGPTNGAGIRFTGSVLTPPEFSGASASNQNPNYGAWNFGQLSTSTDDSKNGVRYRLWTQNRVDAWLYPWERLPNAANNYDGKPADATPAHTVDTPSVNKPNLPLPTSFSSSRAYRMYVVYTPPGSDVHFVPLRIMDWTWNAGGTSTRHTLTNGDFEYEWGPITGTGVVNQNSVESLTFPVWNDSSKNESTWL